MKEIREIEGVIVQPLKQITDQRGSVLHMLRNDWSHFKTFGEIYFSEINPGVVKAWKQHKEQVQNLAVPIGKIRLVIFDDRPQSHTRGSIVEYRVGRPDDYNLIQIPPGLWYGFQALNNETSLIANCPDKPHDPAEAESLPQDSDKIPYHWGPAK
ncbi:MAG: dTDP-4-dehydrorhamnose 3,5-epimerase family protein [Nitrospinae bacterium]|nr:dTDP-4-dehydrorhamnose 3,5-epimerase family protein [Nitrospinota bacterium]